MPSKWETSDIPWDNPDGVANISISAGFSEARQAYNERRAFYSNIAYSDVPDVVNISNEIDFWRSVLPEMGYYYADLRKGEQEGNNMSSKCDDYDFLSSYSQRFSWNRRLTNADPLNPDEYTQGVFEFWQNMEEYLGENLSRIHGDGPFAGGGSFIRPPIHTVNDVVPADILRQLRLIIQSFKVLFITGSDVSFEGVGNWNDEVNQNDFQSGASHQSAFDELSDRGFTSNDTEMNYTARTGLYAQPDILRYNASIRVVPSAEINIEYNTNLNKTTNSPVSIYTISFIPKDAFGIGIIPASDAVFDDLGTSQPEYVLKKFTSPVTNGVSNTVTAWAGLAKSNFVAANPPYPETIIRGFNAEIAFVLMDIDNSTELQYYTP